MGIRRECQKARETSVKSKIEMLLHINMLPFLINFFKKCFAVRAAARSWVTVGFFLAIDSWLIVENNSK